MTQRVMSFEEWSAQRRYVRNLGVESTVRDEALDDCVGLIYPNGYYIEHWVDDRKGIAPPNNIPVWLLTIGNQQFDSGNLNEVERRLYAYAVADLGMFADPTPETWVVAYGSPCKGFKLHGPFPSLEAAQDWGELMGAGGDYAMQVHFPANTKPFNLYPWDKNN